MSKSCTKCGARIADEDTSCPKCRKILVASHEEAGYSPELDEEIPPGTLVAGDYKIVRLVGRGGAGRVYEARQISLRNMPVALKVLHQGFDNNTHVITLMKKEVIISRELTHENIIKIYNLEIADGRHFVVMEYVQGKSFQNILTRIGTCPMDLIGEVFLQVCDALQYAHSRGVIHLDIKPANILVRPSGSVKVCDFGIARATMGDTTTSTQALVIGSVGFMPPEQYTGRGAVSEKSDIYSLGATVYYALSGKVPTGEISRGGIPSCVHQSLMYNPEDRFQSIKEFRRALVQETGLCNERLEAARSVLGSYAGGDFSGAPASAQPVADYANDYVSRASVPGVGQRMSEDGSKQMGASSTTTPKESESVASTTGGEMRSPGKSSSMRMMLVGAGVVLVVLVVVLFVFHHRTSNFEPQKAEILKRIDQRLTRLQQMRGCIQAAHTWDDARACKEKFGMKNLPEKRQR